MRTAITKTNYSNNRLADNQQSQSLTLTIACLSFFPMIYIVGKAIVTFAG